jgi:hypothetical protein
MVRKAVRFVLKHAVAAAAVVIVVVAVTAASYLALILWVLLAGGGLGGPLTFPFMILFALVASVASILVLLPTTAVTQWMCARGACISCCRFQSPRAC